MSTPWDEVRSEAQEVPPRAPRPTPLPWLLLALAVAFLVTVLVVARSRLAEERERTAAALQADDELAAKLRTLEAEVERLKKVASEPDPAVATLKRQVAALEAEKDRLQAQLRTRRR
jgi:septal ring factor EnvC (AmiA/AmiB activator)